LTLEPASYDKYVGAERNSAISQRRVSSGDCSVCLNYVQGGTCHATGGKCILGEAGVLARNDALACELQGKFDVWVMQDDRLFVSDLGIPSDEPKQCLALGINRKLATQIANEKSRGFGTSVVTTQRKCFCCGRSYWMSEHKRSAGNTETGRGYFCPSCIGQQTEQSLTERLGTLGYWCG